MHEASGLLHHVSLVKKIQKRLVRVLMSHVQKIKFDRKSVAPKLVSQPSLDECVFASSHNLCVQDNGWKCKDCLSFCSRSSVNTKPWLRSKCIALPYDDRIHAVPIPSHHVIQIGNVIPNIVLRSDDSWENNAQNDNKNIPNDGEHPGTDFEDLTDEN